jgi:hypothetical protein
MSAKNLRFVAALACLCGMPVASAANLVTAPQGGVARWAGMAASECGIYGKRYAAVDATCYYPVDIKTQPATHEIALWDQDGTRHIGTLTVQPADFPQVEMELPESLHRYLDVSPEDSARAAAEREKIVAVLNASEGPARFSLPLASPVANLPESADDFGSERLFNGKYRSLHSGRDYPVGMGNAVKAVADGKVVLAGDHFFAGRSVYVDHGDGLVSMNFHLDEISVAEGDEVERGQALGKIGSSGRATGPHLHIGVRWLGKRVDPALLFANPTTLPSVSDTKLEAARKIENAEQRDPDEDDVPMDDEG